MYRLSILLLALLLTGCATSMRTYQAADSNIRVMGRHIVTPEGAIDFAASGVTFFMQFEGPELQVELEDEFRDGNHNWFTVVVDGGAPARFVTEPSKRLYVLAEGLKSGPHEIVLSKATEGQNGHNKLVSIRTAKLLPAKPLPTRKIEFIGDSITAGYGADPTPVSCEEGTWYDQTHAYVAYGPRIARSLNAQWMLSAISGMGMHRNWNTLSPVMPDVYEGVYLEYSTDLKPWDFSKYVPDLVLIALGTNDFSKGDKPEPREKLNADAFVRDYSEFVATVRSKYPKARILLVNSPTMGPEDKAALDSYLQRVIDNRKASGDNAIWKTAYPEFWASGCDGHPDMAEQEKMANYLTPVIREIMGW